MSLAVAFVFALLSVVRGQQVGTYQTETHPPLTVSFCTAAGGCTTSSKSVVLDGNWRWLHQTSSTTNCYTGNTWDATLCPDPTTCAANCALDGAEYASTYGITTSGNSLSLQFVTDSSGTKNVGSRMYLMDNSTNYHMFSLLNQEFTFTVDASQLPCGLNGAVYFSQMDSDGGLARFPTNKAGAAYGTGYCDSQCPKDIKFIDGVANIVNWTGDANNANAGTGAYGTCCTEMDIWEANSMSAAVTPHPCTVNDQTQCSGAQCGSSSGNRYTGVCDPDGCDFNSWRMGDETFLGPGLTIDTTKPVTVVTQFITNDGTATGTLSEITRYYVQGNNVFANSFSNVPGMTTQFNSISDAFCDAQKTAFGDTNYFETVGGMKQLGTEMSKGMVLVLSLWDDYAVDMLWLDSIYPTNASASTPGANRGPCATTSGVPATVESQSPNVKVIYSNIKYGDINSTFPAAMAQPAPPPGGSAPVSSAPSSTPVGPTSSKPTSTSKPATPTTSSAAPTSTSTSPHYGQCGGIGWTGPTACVAGTTCQELNPYYYQCL